MANNALVVGAGPTGLTMAIELLRLGVPVRLIDKSLHPAQFSQALVIQARTLEQFERYRIAEETISQGRKLFHISIISEGRNVVKFEFHRIPGRYPFLLFLPQSQTEKILTAHLESLGGRIERGTQFLAFKTAENDLVATLQLPDGTHEQWSGTWLIACDGAHSLVREQTRTPFVGDRVGLTFFLADLHLDGPDIPGDELKIYLHRGDVVFLGRLTDDLCRVIVASHDKRLEPKADKQLALSDFQEAIDRAGIRVTAKPGPWMTPFYISQRKVENYRVGGVFFAGDAAHIHSPVAGQGMNTGLQDAANLGWKIAAASRGAADGLLDTYHHERNRVGETLMKITSRGLAAATNPNALFESIRDSFLSFATSLEPVQNAAAGFVSETSINYRRSPAVMDYGPQSSLHAGDRMPNFPLTLDGAQQGWLLDALREPKHLVISIGLRNERQLIERVPRANFLFLPTPSLRSADDASQAQPFHQLFGLQDRFATDCIFVVRPDGYIGFRGSSAHLDRLEYYARLNGLTL